MKIIEKRKLLNISTIAIAKELDISESLYCYYEEHEKEIELKTFLMIMKILDFTFFDYFD